MGSGVFLATCKIRLLFLCLVWCLTKSLLPKLNVKVLNLITFAYHANSEINYILRLPKGWKDYLAF